MGIMHLFYQYRSLLCQNKNFPEVKHDYKRYSDRLISSMITFPSRFYQEGNRLLSNFNPCGQKTKENVRVIILFQNKIDQYFFASFYEKKYAKSYEPDIYIGQNTYVNIERRCGSKKYSFSTYELYICRGCFWRHFRQYEAMIVAAYPDLMQEKKRRVAQLMKKVQEAQQEEWERKPPQQKQRLNKKFIRRIQREELCQKMLYCITCCKLGECCCASQKNCLICQGITCAICICSFAFGFANY